jgi:hypothetical protein
VAIDRITNPHWPQILPFLTFAGAGWGGSGGVEKQMVSVCLPRLALPFNGMGGNGKAGLGFVFGVALALAFIFDEEPSTHTT